jgi:hypothetical protein
MAILPSVHMARNPSPKRQADGDQAGALRIFPDGSKSQTLTFLWGITIGILIFFCFDHVVFMRPR